MGETLYRVVILKMYVRTYVHELFPAGGGGEEATEREGPEQTRPWEGEVCGGSVEVEGGEGRQDIPPAAQVWLFL